MQPVRVRAAAEWNSQTAVAALLLECTCLLYAARLPRKEVITFTDIQVLKVKHIEVILGYSITNEKNHEPV